MLAGFTSRRAAKNTLPSSRSKEKVVGVATLVDMMQKSRDVKQSVMEEPPYGLQGKKEDRAPTE